MQQNESEPKEISQPDTAVVWIEPHYVCPRCRRRYVGDPVGEPLGLGLRFSISFHAAGECLGAFCLYCLVEAIRSLMPELITWTPRANDAPDPPPGAQRG